MEWNERVTEWEQVAASPAFQRLADRVLEAADPQPDDQVVDLGAGTGLLTFRIAPLVANVMAIDAAPAMVDRLLEISRDDGIDNIDGTVADLRDLRLPAGSRTLAVSNYAYHHLDHDGKLMALRELHRVLAPNGRVVICDMMFALSVRGRDRRIILDKMRLMARRGPAGIVRILRNAGRVATGSWEHPERPQAWAEMLEQAGLTDIKTFELTNESGLVTARRP